MRVRPQRTRARRYQTGGSGEAIPKHIGQPETVLADNGYLNEDAVRTLEGRADEEADRDDAPRMNVLISAHAEAKQLQRKHDFRPSPTDPNPDSSQPISDSPRKFFGDSTLGRGVAISCSQVPSVKEIATLRSQ